MEAFVEQRNFGQAAFTKPGLALYDALVLGMTCRYIWRCPNARVLEVYRRHLSGNHLEVGVGTGYFLDHVNFPVAQPRLALLDLNANCLERTAKRVARYAPTVHQANVLEPIALGAPRFDSIGLNYVLHCVPGSFPDKGKVLLHLKQLLNPGGVMFGATVLASGVPHTWASSTALRYFNAHQTLNNAEDDYAQFADTLRQHLQDVTIDVVGCVALFSGRA